MQNINNRVSWYIFSLPFTHIFTVLLSRTKKEGVGVAEEKNTSLGKASKNKKGGRELSRERGDKTLIHFLLTLIKSSHSWQPTIVSWVYKVSIKAPFPIKSSTSSTNSTEDKASPIRLLKCNRDPPSQINVFLFHQSLPLWKCVSNHSSLFLDLLLLSSGPAVNCGGGTMKPFMWKKKKERKLPGCNALSPFLYHCEHTERNKRNIINPLTSGQKAF